MNALDKTNFGCYIPYIPQIKATEDMPQGVLDHRNNNIEQALVHNFIQ